MKILKYLIVLCVLLYTQTAYAEQYKKWNNVIINKDSVRTVRMYTVNNTIRIWCGYGNYIYFKYKDNTETKKAFNNFYTWLNERK